MRDLGLIARDVPLRIANPIYAEVVPRELTCATQAGLAQDVAWYVDADGGLNVVELLTAFQEFFREHSEHWVRRFDYQEAGPQLLLQAFLQRIVNGGGRIEREYGLGRGRTDLLIIWPQGERVRKFVVECKILRKSLERTLSEGVEANGSVHGSVRGRGGSPRHLRPRHRQVGRQGIPPPRVIGRRRHSRVGHVTLRRARGIGVGRYEAASDKMASPGNADGLTGHVPKGRQNQDT